MTVFGGSHGVGNTLKKKKKKKKTFSPLSLTERPKQFLKGWIDMIKALS